MENILAVGPSPSLIDNNMVLNSGIKAIINLQDKMHYDKEGLQGILVHHIPVEDFSIPTDDHVTKFLVTVQHHFERGESVYVHCTAGCGRSGTMIGIWLSTIKPWPSFDTMITFLRNLRPCAIETDAQMDLVHTYFKKFND